MDTCERIEQVRRQLQAEQRSQKVFKAAFQAALLLLLMSISAQTPILLPAALCVASLVMLIKCAVGVGSLCGRIETMQRDCEKTRDCQGK